MNDLHDDPQLRHTELNKINVLTDKPLDFASELCHGGNREWNDGINNINTINDKTDLVNEIGETIDSYTTDAYNIIDAINKSHNNDSLYNILAEDLKKCKDTIFKIIIVIIYVLNKILRKMTLIMPMYVRNRILLKMTLIMPMYVKNRILLKMKQVLMKIIARLMMMIMIVSLMMIMIARLMMMMMIVLIRIFLI